MAIKTYDESTVTYDEADITFDGNTIFTKLISDTVSLGEGFYRYIEKALSEVLVVADASIKQFERIFSEGIGVVEDFAKQVTYVRSAIDYITSTEIFKVFRDGIQNIWKNTVRIASTIYTERTKPSTSYTERTKPSTSWTERVKNWLE